MRKFGAFLKCLYVYILPYFSKPVYSHVRAFVYQHAC